MKGRSETGGGITLTGIFGVVKRYLGSEVLQTLQNVHPIGNSVYQNVVWKETPDYQYLGVGCTLPVVWTLPSDLNPGNSRPAKTFADDPPQVDL